MFKHRSILITLLFLCGATGWSAAETTGTDPLKVISRDSTFYYASLVNDYFMRTYPDPTANSYVGGKKRNSRIWTRGVFYEGLLNLYREEQRPEWLDYAVEWGEFHDWYSCTDSQRRHADFQCCGQAYIQMYLLDTSHPERIEHIKMRIDDRMATDKVDDWYWVDAIQMAMPIFAMLGGITGDEAYWERMYDMYTYTRNRHGGSKKGGGKPLFNEQTGLWYRDYQFDPPYKDKVETDKDCYWSRGNGWVYAGLAILLETVPESDPSYDFYRRLYLEMTEAILACQDENGSWRPSLLDPEVYPTPENSGSAFFIYGLAWGVNHGILKGSVYRKAVKRAWKALCSHVREDGRMEYVQPVGARPRITKPDQTEGYGVGAFLLAASEIVKM